MAIALRATAIRTGTGTSTTIAVTIPATTQVGDLLVLNLVDAISASTYTTSGWTQIGTAITKTTVLVHQAFYRVAQAGDAGTTLTFSTNATAQKGAAQIAVFSGVDTTTPILNSAQLTDASATAAHVAASGTASSAYDASVSLVANRGTVSATADWTVGSPMTEAVEGQPGSSGSAGGVIAYNFTPGASGSTYGGATFTSTFATANWGSFSITLKAAAAPGAGSVIHTWVGAPTSTGFEVVSKTGGATSVQLAYSTNSGMASPSYVSAQTPDSDGRVKHVVTGLSADTRYYYQLVDTPSGGSATFIGSIGSIKTLQTKGVPFNGTRKVVIGACITTGATDMTALDNAIAWAPDWGHFNGDFTYSGTTSTVPSDHAAKLDTQITAVASLKEFISKGLAARYNVSDHDCGVTDNGDSNNAFTAANITAYKTVVPYGTLLDSLSEGREQQWDDGRVSYFMLDVRNINRSTGTDTDNSSKTMLGAGQKARLKTWLSTNNAPFKVIISDVQWLGVADAAKPDWWPSYSTERAEIAAYINKYAVGYVELWHGDAHALGYATAAQNTVGGFPILCAAPYHNTGGGRQLSTFSAYFNNSGLDAREYGRVTFTDDGKTITRTFSGWDAITNTEKLSNVVAVPTRIKVWNGTAWVSTSVKSWDGTGWQDKPVKYWNGSAWTLVK